MLLGGLWHGAAWTFVVWGGIHGAGLAVERFFATGRALRAGRAATALPALARPARHVQRRVLRLDLLPRRLLRECAQIVIERLFTAWGQPSPLVDHPSLLAILAGIGTQYVARGAYAAAPAALPAAVAGRASGLRLGAGLVVVDALGPPGVAPFIYFRF